MTRILDNDDVRKAIDLDECLEALTTAYRDLPEGRSVHRPTSHVYTHHSMDGASYSFKSVEGAVERFGVLALRITSDVVREETYNGAVRVEKLPLAGRGLFLGLVQVFSLETGELLGIMPDGVIQQTRVAVTSALGAKVLCRPDAARLGLIGTGGQARAHFRLLTHVLPIKTVKVYSPRPEHREAFAEEMDGTDGIEVEPTGSVASAVAGCDIICTATSTSSPIISGDLLEPGVHYNAIREFELDETVYAKADVTGIHTQMGGIRHHLPPGVDQLPGIRQEKPRDWTVYPEISDFLSGRTPGRANADQITFFLNNIGTGVQFAAMGHCILKAAEEMGLGKEVASDWFLQDIKP